MSQSEMVKLTTKMLDYAIFGLEVVHFYLSHF